MKNVSLLVFFAVVMSVLMLINCNSSDTNGDTSWTDGRTECVQPIDCGEDGRNGWVCRDGYCFTIDEFCFSNEECNGNCVNHTCENGKVEDGDQVVIDGDDELEMEAEPEQVPCEYTCCTDADCGDNAFCDTDEHKCVVIVDCPPEKECCQDHDCQTNPVFGENFVCKLNKCIDENAPCPYECCANEDCPSGYICVSDDDGEGNHCQNNSFSCTPGNKTCCMYDPGNPECNAQGELKSEVILTCNAEGNDYNLGWCPDFHDCKLDESKTDVTCVANGRCETDADCACPRKCFETETVKKCMVPFGLKEGEKCYEEACDPPTPVTIGYCEDGLTCMVDQETNEGYCQVESK